jgi:single-stranded-DNA-specific exonuclease
MSVVGVTEPELRGQRGIWRIESRIPATVSRALAGESVMLAHLLYCRGYRTPEDIRAFLAGAPISHDPFLLPDMDAAAQRIARAVRERERVAVYGDFDCDGITATAVLVATLSGLGLSPIACIPTREDGHGLHPEALAELSDAGVTLIVTGDCGITAMEEVQVAAGMGMDVVITDHHEARIDGSLPACPAVNPTRHDSLYPFRSLSGAGVAYKVAQALRARLPGAPDPDALLDLVALGTIADVVPLRDENRSLVLGGLERLRRTARPGLRALYRVAGVNPGRIDPISVGFYLAPRINAANRMARPQLAYDLIMAGDEALAEDLARRLSDYNQQRQALVAETLEMVTGQLGEPEAVRAAAADGSRPPIVVVVGRWGAGISGLLASKLVDAYGLSAFVGSEGEDGTVAVSARGAPGVHIDEILEACEAALPGGLFLGYGGHARAGGFRVAADRAELALDVLEEQARRVIRPDTGEAALVIDAEVRLEQLTLRAARHVRSLAPFGMDFSEPLFLARDVEMAALTPLKGNAHARLRLRQGRTHIGAVLFGAPPAFLELRAGTRLDIVFHLQLSDWGGSLTPELSVRDWRLTD